MQTWKQITARMKPGRLIKDGAYRVESTDDKGISIIRVATGSKVRITRKAIEKADARLATGVLIPLRSISYTVAVETLIVLALGKGIIRTTDKAGVACYAKGEG